MHSVTEALEIVLQNVKPLAAQAAPLSAALGLVLAEDVVSDMDMPPFDKAMMDGFAVRAADLRDGQAELTIVEEIPAGKTPTVDVNVGGGSHAVGNFLSLSGTRTDRFLDPPEFQPLHDTGNKYSFFDRLDARTGATGTFHLNVQAARSSFDVPTSLDDAALGQAQHQAINTLNVAPGYSQVIGARTLFTAKSAWCSRTPHSSSRTNGKKRRFVSANHWMTVSDLPSEMVASTQP